LDVVRAQAFIGELRPIDPSQVVVHVIGGHSAETMLPVLSQVSGGNFSDEEAKKLTLKIKDAGTVVVNAKDGAGSATLSMAYAGARFTSSLVKALQGEKGVVECAFVQVEGMEVSFFGLPVEIGKTGISKYYPLPKLNDYEQGQLKEILVPLAQNIETGVSFGKL